MTVINPDRSYDESEVDFFLDMAVNECQRWLEASCREIFIDSDDFIYSLRHGCHLRKVINKLVPDCFDLSPERFKRAPRSTRKVLQNAGVKTTSIEKYIEDDDWSSQLLVICWRRICIPLRRLFQPGDLLTIDNYDGPYKLYLTQSCEADELSPSKCETSENGRIRRLCCTISYLAEECSRVDRSIPRLDITAVEPLIEYNDFLYQQNTSTLNSSEHQADPLNFPELDVVSTLSSIVDQVCSEEDKRSRTETLSASSDEGFDTMVECNYAVSKYLADGSSEYSTEDFSSYSAETKSSRSCSPYIGERSFSGSEQLIPTRTHVKVASQVAHNPLQFIGGKSTAVALQEQAKQQIIISEEQKRIRVEAQQVMHSSFLSDDEPAWQSNLDSWLSKRRSKSASNKIRPLEVSPKEARVPTELSGRKLVIERMTATAEINNDEYIIQEKDEVLTLKGSSIPDDHTDSGIENNPVPSSQQSPSTSSELSPQAGWNRSEDYTASAQPTNTRSSLSPGIWSLPKPADQPPPPPVSVPPEEIKVDIAERSDLCEEGLTDNLLQIDNSQLRKLDKNSEQKSSVGSKKPENIVSVNRIGNRNEGRGVLRRDASIGSVSEIAAKFESPQGTDSKPRLEKTVSVPHKDHTSAFVEKFESDTLSKSRANSLPEKTFNSGDQDITLGVELCREQTANVTAVKFPQRDQRSTTSRSFKEPIDDHEQPLRDSGEASSSYVPFTTANLASIRDRTTLEHSSETYSESVVKTEPPQVPHRQKNTPAQPEEDASAEMPSIMTTVEISFEDVPGAAYQPRNSDHHGGRLPDSDGVMLVNLDLGHRTKNAHKYFGFTIAGGKDKESPLRIETVLAGTPADDCGLQVGDLILNINGESVQDQYHQSVIRMLHEAARLGEVELKIRRIAYFAGRGSDSLMSPCSTLERRARGIEAASFDEKRSMFDHKSESGQSFDEFRQRRRHQQPSKWSNSLDKKNRYANVNTNDNNATVHKMTNKFDAITGCLKYGLSPVGNSVPTGVAHSSCSPSLSPYDEDPANDFDVSPRDRCSTFGSSTDSAIYESSLQLGSSLNSTRSSPRGNTDYRVISMHDKPEPGKLSDFIPEVERTTPQSVHEQHSRCDTVYGEETKRREINTECGRVVSSLSDMNDANATLIRNYDAMPFRSNPVSPVQQKMVDFTKREEDMTYIPLARKAPPVPHKPVTAPPPPPTSPPPDDGEVCEDEETHAVHSFLQPNQLKQDFEGPAQEGDRDHPRVQMNRQAAAVGERNVQSSSSSMYSQKTRRSRQPAEKEVSLTDGLQKLPTMAGIRDLVSGDRRKASSSAPESDQAFDSQRSRSRSTERIGSLTPLTLGSWTESGAASTTSTARGDSVELLSPDSGSGCRTPSTLRSQQRSTTASSFPDADKRVTFGYSETHEITPRQTQEIVYPCPEEPRSESRQRQPERDSRTVVTTERETKRETLTRNEVRSSSVDVPKSVEIIHPIRISRQPEVEKRAALSRSSREEENRERSRIDRRRDRKEWYSGKIPQSQQAQPFSSSSVQVRCSSCHNLLAEAPQVQNSVRSPPNSLRSPPPEQESTRIQRSHQEDSQRFARYLSEENVSSRQSHPIAIQDRRLYAARRENPPEAYVQNPDSYEYVSERYYDSVGRTNRYAARSLSPQRARITINYESYDPRLRDLYTTPELLEATDSREWRQIIEQQRLPNASDASSKNRIDADSKFRIVQAPTGSINDAKYNASSWASSVRNIPPSSNIEPSRNNRSMDGTESRRSDHSSSVMRTSVEVLHRFPDQAQGQSTDSDRYSETSSRGAAQSHTRLEPKSSEPMVAVSGKHRCSHCQMELGRGAAMIIESLNLFYHLSCFRCYVCNAPLGNGKHGADVRVKDSRLHCQSCFSSDEAGLKSSQV